MCWEDIRIGRNSYSRQHTVAIAVTATPLLPANPRRVAVVLTSSIGAVVTYGNTDGITAGIGITMNSVDRPVILTVREVGDMVQKPWFAIVNIATSVIIWEVILTAEQANQLEG